MASAGEVTVQLKADTSGFTRNMERVEQRILQSDATLSGLNRTVTMVTASVASLGGALMGLKLVGAAQDAALASARYVTLGVVVQQVGRTAGYTAQQLDDYDKALQKAGISMTGSRSAMAQLIAAQVDLAQSADLARIAQDAAVIGGINSTEAFGRMTTGIANANTVVLRGIGLNVNFEKSYADLAARLGKTTDELTDIEQVQARTNAVLDEGAKIAGAYDAAMGTAGKTIGSMPRQIDNLKVKLGALFDETLQRSAMGFYSLLVNINKALDAFGQARIQTISRRIADGVGFMTNALAGLAVILGARLLVALNKATMASMSKAGATRAMAVSASFAASAEAAAAASVTAAEEKATAAKLANLRATHAAIIAAREEATARLQAANQIKAAAARVPISSLAPLGGAAVEREMARRAAATKAASAATKELAILGQQEARVRAQLTAATNAHTQAQRANTAAQTHATKTQAIHGALIASTTVRARAAAAALGLFRGALGLIGGVPGLIAIGLGTLAFRLLETRRAAKTAARDISTAVDEIADKWSEFNEVHTLAKMGETSERIGALQEELRLAKELADAQAETRWVGGAQSGQARQVWRKEDAANVERITQALTIQQGVAGALATQYSRLAAARLAVEGGGDDPSRAQKIAQVHKDLANALAHTEQMERLLGAHYDANQARVSAYTSALEGMLALGLDPSTKQVQDYAAALVGVHKEVARLAEVERIRAEAQRTIDRTTAERKRAEEQERERLEAAARSLYERTLTAQQLYDRDVATLKAALEQKLIAQTDFDQAMRGAQERLSKSLEDQAKQATKTLAETLREQGYHAGESLMRGILTGARNMGDILKNALINLAVSYVMGPVKGALGIASPSKVFQRYGEAIGQGMALGIQASTTRVGAATERMIAAVRSPNIQAGGALAMAPMGGAMALMGTANRPMIDPSRLPKPMGPLQASRDADWLSMLAESQLELATAGHRGRR